MDNIKKVVGVKCILFEGEYRILKQDVAKFFEVSDRAIENIIAKNQEELAENGYELYEGNKLESFKLAISKADVSELNFGYKARHFATFNFRAFLNVAMLLTRSEKAKVLRSVILDIVIDTISERAGGSTKYINQRDEDFVLSLLTEPKMTKCSYRISI